MNIHNLFRYTPDHVNKNLRQATDGYVLNPDEGFLPSDEVKTRVQEFVSEPATDIISFPYLTPAYCAELIELCEEIDQFKHRPGDEYPAPEMDLKDISPYINATHIEMIEKHVLPVATSVWGFPVIWLSSAFIVKHSMDGQTGNAGWHHDALGDITLSVQLNDNFEQGGVYFERQDFMAGKLKAGEAILFPSKVTHRHTALNITSGTRYSLTYWMAGDVPEGLSLRTE